MITTDRVISLTGTQRGYAVELRDPMHLVGPPIRGRYFNANPARPDDLARAYQAAARCARRWERRQAIGHHLAGFGLGLLLALIWFAAGLVVGLGLSLASDTLTR